MDLFNSISAKVPTQEWELLTSELIKKKYVVTLKELATLLKDYGAKKVTPQQQEALWETFKVKKNLEDNPEDMGDRLINVKELVSSKLTRHTRRINELIQVQLENE